MNEQITRVSFAENECIFHVTRVQITKSARCQNFVCLDFLRFVTTCFLVQFGVNKHL